MPARDYNITIEKGATYKLVVNWLDKDDQPIDITNYTGRMQIRKTQDAATVEHELTTVNGGIQILGSSGIINLTISALDTRDMDWLDNEGVYDLEIESPTQEVFRVLQGSVALSPEVTR